MTVVMIWNSNNFGWMLVLVKWCSFQPFDRGLVHSSLSSMVLFYDLGVSVPFPYIFELSCREVISYWWTVVSLWVGSGTKILTFFCLARIWAQHQLTFTLLLCCIAFIAPQSYFSRYWKCPVFFVFIVNFIRIVWA